MKPPTSWARFHGNGAPTWVFQKAADAQGLKLARVEYLRGPGKPGHRWEVEDRATGAVLATGANPGQAWRAYDRGHRRTVLPSDGKPCTVLPSDRGVADDRVAEGRPCTVLPSDRGLADASLCAAGPADSVAEGAGAKKQGNLQCAGVDSTVT